MPTVLRLGGLRIVVYPNDHRPAHVHVLGGGREAVFLLNCPAGPARLRASRNLGIRELNDIATALQQALDRLCEAWSRFHGHY